MSEVHWTDKNSIPFEEDPNLELSELILQLTPQIRTNLNLSCDECLTPLNSFSQLCPPNSGPAGSSGPRGHRGRRGRPGHHSSSSDSSSSSSDCECDDCDFVENQFPCGVTFVPPTLVFSFTGPTGVTGTVSLVGGGLTALPCNDFIFTPGQVQNCFGGGVKFIPGFITPIGPTGCNCLPSVNRGGFTFIPGAGITLGTDMCGCPGGLTFMDGTFAPNPHPPFQCNSKKGFTFNPGTLTFTSQCGLAVVGEGLVPFKVKCACSENKPIGPTGHHDRDKHNRHHRHHNNHSSSSSSSENSEDSEDSDSHGETDNTYTTYTETISSFNKHHRRAHKPSESHDNDNKNHHSHQSTDKHPRHHKRNPHHSSRPCQCVCRCTCLILCTVTTCSNTCQEIFNVRKQKQKRDNALQRHNNDNNNNTTHNNNNNNLIVQQRSSFGIRATRNHCDFHLVATPNCLHKIIFTTDYCKRSQKYSALIKLALHYTALPRKTGVHKGGFFHTRSWSHSMKTWLYGHNLLPAVIATAIDFDNPHGISSLSLKHSLFLFGILEGDLKSKLCIDACTCLKLLAPIRIDKIECNTIITTGGCVGKNYPENVVLLLIVFADSKNVYEARLQVRTVLIDSDPCKSSICLPSETTLDKSDRECEIQLSDDEEITIFYHLNKYALPLLGLATVGSCCYVGYELEQLEQHAHSSSSSSSSLCLPVCKVKKPRLEKKKKSQHKKRHDSTSSSSSSSDSDSDDKKDSSKEKHGFHQSLGLLKQYAKLRSRRRKKK